MKRTRGRTWQTIRRAVLTADPLCQHCKAKGVTKLAEQVDHIIPLHKGGTDERGNLQGLCHGCHLDTTRAERPDAKPIIRAADW